MATPRSELAQLLKDSRLEAGYSSQAALAREIHMTRTVVTKAESPTQPVPSNDVLIAWARVTRTALERLNEIANRCKSSSPEWFMPYLAAEQGASLIRIYGFGIVPGLFQTESYAHAVLAAYGHSPERLADLLTTRLGRKQVIDRARIIVVIDAAVLSRCIGSPSTMAEQCADLAALAERPNVSLHIVPEGANTGVWAGLQIASRGSLATVCMTTGLDDVTSTAPDQIDAAMAAFERVMGVALPCPESLDYARTWEATWKERM